MPRTHPHRQHVDHEPGQARRGRTQREQRSGSRDVGDGAVRQLAGQSPDQVADRGVRAPAMPSRSVARDRQAGVVAAPPVQQQVDPIIGDLDDDFFEDGAHDTLARLRCRIRIGPGRLEVSAERPQALVLRLRQRLGSDSASGRRPSGWRASLPVVARRRARAFHRHSSSAATSSPSVGARSRSRPSACSVSTPFRWSCRSGSRQRCLRSPGVSWAPPSCTQF